LDLYKWDKEDNNFNSVKACGTANCGSNLINVIPVDINYDGLLDIV